MQGGVGARGVASPQLAVREGPAPRPRRRGGLASLTPYVLLAPAAIFVLLFFLQPLIRSLLIAFQTPAGQWTTDNLRNMVNDGDFPQAIRNTVILMALIIPIETVVALGMAVVAQGRLRAQGFFLYVWSIPLAISDLAAGVVWLSVFTYHGYLNTVLQDLHLLKVPAYFLAYNSLPSLFAAMVIAEVWRSISLVMVVVLSGLQGIPNEVLEAAESLGASSWQRFRHVTLPLLKPTIQVALIMRTTAAFTVFAAILALGGGTFHILAGEAYRWINDAHNYQLAASYGLLIMV
ncbi:MAG: sugar ABC transporter permease, partial [Candidatus Dormibacteraeota bacterium]|nr:sugar ABC transporter permease [Candidatus Dormibacteraeota bacterium]